MTNSIYKPYDPDSSLGGCSCGMHHDEVSHNAAEIRAQRERASNPETLSQDFVEATLVKALFPQESVRRKFLRAVGSATAMSAA